MKNRIVYTPSGASKKRRRGRRILFYAVIGMAVFLLPIGAAIALRMPSLQIRKTTLRGVSTLDTNEIWESIGSHLEGTRMVIIPRSSFFLLDPQAIVSDLERRFPRIKHAEAIKTFPDKLEVTITERTWWGIFCNGLDSPPALPDSAAGRPNNQHVVSSSSAEMIPDSKERDSLIPLPRRDPGRQAVVTGFMPTCGYMDSTGIVYESAPEPRGNLIIVIRTDTQDTAMPRQAVDIGAMAQIRALAEKLPTETGVTPAGFELHTRVPSEIRASASEGFTLVFRREDDVSATLRVLKRVLNEEIKDKRKHLDYIDLRFGNKVFYKLR